jgi:serine/threonine protein kinase
MLHHGQNGTPLLVYDPIRIAWEVATAVAFLHSARPDPITHRDLKPANILLDQNLASKVGDVGLLTSLLLPAAT